MEKDREWKEKFDRMATEKEEITTELQEKLGKAESEKMIIKKNYEAQLNMMSEQLVELNLQNERLRGMWELRWLEKVNLIGYRHQLFILKWRRENVLEKFDADVSRSVYLLLQKIIHVNSCCYKPILYWLEFRQNLNWKTAFFDLLFFYFM